MNLFFKRILFSFTLIACAVGEARAEVTLPSFFTDNMVLQQKANVPFWGESNASSVKITTSWDNKTYTVKTSGGDWQVNLKTPIYGGPYIITINDGDEVQLKNILIGEVWLCSGQSNMEMPLEGWGKVLNYEEEIKNADYPQIRLLQAEHVESAAPLNELKVQHGGWLVCSPQTIADFSATAYFFARKIYNEKKIPIGLVHSSWGGTVAEAWTSAEALHTIHDFDAALEGMKDEESREALQQKYNAEMNTWAQLMEKADKGMNDGKAIWAQPEYNDAQWVNMPVPSFFENRGFPDFDGAVWYRKTVNLAKISGDALLEYYADDNDKLYVNGTEIGGTDGYNVLRHYTIPASILKNGVNIITIRVQDTGSGGGVYGPDTMTLKVGNDDYSLAGDWKFATGVSLKDLPPAPYMPQGQNRPTALYNAMIHPLLKYKFAGVIWYQGESNAHRAQQYQTLFPLLINDWRKQLGDKKLPFYFVQLANYMQSKTKPEESAWAELREAQTMALKLPNTGMIVATDIGNAEDIHPKNKQEIGERLARIALAKNYGVKIPYSGPMYKSFAKKGTSITVEFDFSEGIKTQSGTALKGFAVAGEDKVFHRAEAKIEENKVVLTSPQVANPVAVRYNWANNPDGNLVNASGLPASPFRTDTWPGITKGRK